MDANTPVALAAARYRGRDVEGTDIELGPVDYVVAEFPGGEFNGEIAQARGRPDAGTPRLEPTDFATLRDWLICELILARAAVESGGSSTEHHMARAVELALSEGFVKFFLEERAIGTGLAPSAAAALDRAGRTQLAVALGAAPRSGLAGQPAVVLSERDRAVLRFLPSGLTNQEIARGCFMSVNTVKTHLKSIYAKLGVSSRTAAAERARQLGLL